MKLTLYNIAVSVLILIIFKITEFVFLSIAKTVIENKYVKIFKNINIYTYIINIHIK